MKKRLKRTFVNDEVVEPVEVKEIKMSDIEVDKFWYNCENFTAIKAECRKRGKFYKQMTDEEKADIYKKLVESWKSSRD